MTSPTVRLGSLPALRISPGTLLTVLLFAALMYPSLARGGVAPTTAVLLALGIGVFMIVSVLVHEVAHAVVARGFGASVDHIALTLWGGHTQYRSRQMSTLGSLLVSLSGPAANLLLAGVSTGIGQLSEPGTGAAVFFTVSSWLNLVLAVFNLIPIPPLDGSRLFGALFPPLKRVFDQFEANPMSFMISMFLVFFVLRQPIGNMLSAIQRWAFSLVF